ncbi:MAG: DUF2335 domain-containing protein [Treponema sp.]|jgi:uncharacterized membrane protein|nr:DUF2335 domain-containing protein [Treponema sp.]
MSNRIKKDSQIAATTQEPAEYSFMAVRQSPLPPPAELEKFEVLYPGATKLVFDNFISQSNHRMELEKMTISGDNKRADRGQIISAILSVLCIAIGGFLTYLGKDIVGLSLIFGSIGTLLTAFYGGAIIRKIERTKKDKN